ncbi:DoxX family protein [uncultured Microscilla sp.]|uniref:DoxX family protein n=1 Tax=uncultured Microscilla sp. TaxID=432653 RepID=UPI00261FC664|nr:DoxX family protein [uncultured Microscilla sp.]
MKKNIVWIAQLISALFMLQTIFLYKFPGHKDSIYIFSTIGMEPYGRIGSGVVELIASVLLLTSRYSWIGALLGLGTMSGALFFHLTTLGIVVNNDHGFLFAMAAILWTCCLIVLILRKKYIPIKL